MYHQKAIITVALVLATFFVVLTGCEGPAGPTGTSGSSLTYITGGVDTPDRYDPTGDAWVSILNCPTVPNVTVNGNRLIGLRNFYKMDNFPIAARESANLRVTFTKLDGSQGTAQADVILPGVFHITSHDTSDENEISVGSDVTVRWTASEGADFYHTYIAISYSWYDTSESRHYFSYRNDTLQTDTSITFSASHIFPDAEEISRVDYSWGNCYVNAAQGPYDVGEEGNVTGDGMGFSYGWTNGGYFDIRVSGSTFQRMNHEEPQSPMKRFLQKRANSLFLEN